MTLVVRGIALLLLRKLNLTWC